MAFHSRATLISLLFPLFFGAQFAVAADDLPRSGWHEYENRVRVSADEDAKFSVNGDEVSVAAGDVIIDSTDRGNVKLPLSTVATAKGSLVLCSVQKGFEHVFVLLGDATLMIGHHRTPLRTGEEAAVADHQPSYPEMVGDAIGRRRTRVTPLPDDRYIVLSEFSHTHIMSNHRLVSHLAHSSDPHDRALREKLLKTAAVLNIVTGSHGQYSLGGP